MHASTYKDDVVLSKGRSKDLQINTILLAFDSPQISPPGSGYKLHFLYNGNTSYHEALPYGS